MTARLPPPHRWLPTLAGLALTVVWIIYVMDAPLGPSFLVTVMPPVILLASTVAGVVRPLWGAAGFTLLAVVSIVVLRTPRNLEALLTVTVPLLLLAGLHVWRWLRD